MSANTTAQSGVHYVLTAAVTLTLPASPAVRDVVQITDLSGSYQAIVNPNGQLIRGQSGNLTLNAPVARFSLIYSGASKGWI